MIENPIFLVDCDVSDFDESTEVKAEAPTWDPSRPEYSHQEQSMFN